MIDNPQAERRRTHIEAALADAHQDLYRFLLRRLGDPHDAADVLQDFFVRVLSRFGDLRDEDRLMGWMASVLRSTIADHYRSKVGQLRFESACEADPTVASGVTDEDIDLVICACLYKLLPTLKDEYAAIVWRADLTGEPRSAIAADMGLDENAFRVKLHRARKALRERLEQTCETCLGHGFFECECPGAKSLRAQLADGRSQKDNCDV